MYTVSITSQGQISIPAPIRKALGFRKNSKVVASVQDGKMVVEAAPDFLSLSGVFNKYAKKGMTPSQILKMEKRAVEDAVVERYLAKEKRSGNKLLKIRI